MTTRDRTLEILIIGIILLAMAFLPACGTKHSQVRFVNACPDVQENGNAANVDVLVDGRNIATDLAFPAYTGYQTVTSGNHDIEVRYTGTSNDLVNAPNVNIFSHAQYTVFFTGLTHPPSGSPNQTINPVNDDNSAPVSGDIKLRFFHASPSGPARVDIYAVAPGTDITNTSPSINSLAYQQVSNYLSIAAGSYELILTPSGSKSRTVDETPTAFLAAQIRTFVLLDVAGGGTVSGTLLEIADVN